MSTIWFLLALLVVGVVMVGVISRAAGPRKAGRGGLARRSLTTAQRESVGRKWEGIRELLSLGRPSNLTAAVVEADNLLDSALKSLGASGSTLGERLRSAEGRFSDYDGTWQAHKLRNRLVHESDYEPRPSEVQRAVGQFERALRDLGALR